MDQNLAEAIAKADRALQDAQDRLEAAEREWQRAAAREPRDAAAIDESRRCDDERRTALRGYEQALDVRRRLQDEHWNEIPLADREAYLDSVRRFHEARGKVPTTDGGEPIH